MLIEEDLDKVDHRSAVLRRSVDPCHLVRRGTQGSCHRDRTPVRLGLRKRLGLMPRNVSTAAILLDSERTELVDEEKEISGSKIVEGPEQNVDLLSIARVGTRNCHRERAKAPVAPVDAVRTRSSVKNLKDASAPQLDLCGARIAWPRFLPNKSFEAFSVVCLNPAPNLRRRFLNLPGDFFQGKAPVLKNCDRLLPEPLVVGLPPLCERLPVGATHKADRSLLSWRNRRTHGRRIALSGSQNPVLRAVRILDQIVPSVTEQNWKLLPCGAQLNSERGEAKDVAVAEIEVIRKRITLGEANKLHRYVAGHSGLLHILEEGVLSQVGVEPPADAKLVKLVG